MGLPGLHAERQAPAIHAAPSASGNEQLHTPGLRGVVPTAQTAPRSGAQWATGWYHSPDGVAVGPLSQEQALQLDARAQLWFCDGQHSHGPYGGDQLAAYWHKCASEAADTRQLTYAQATHGLLSHEEQHLSQLAQAAGTSLQDVVAFCHSSARLGAGQQPDEPEQQTAGDFGDGLLPQHPGVTEGEAKQRCRGWRKLARAKKARKARQRTEWLFK